MTESTIKIIERRIQQIELSIKDSKKKIERASKRDNSGILAVCQNNMQEIWSKELEELKYDLKENIPASSCSETERH